MMELLKDRSILQLTGSDSKSFLQKLITNDVSQQVSYNYLLTNQGRYLFDFFAVKKDDGFYLDIASNQLLDLVKRLSLYKLRSDIKISDLSDELHVCYARQNMPEYLNIGAQMLYKDPRSNFLGYRGFITKTAATALQIIPSELYLEDKYNFAVPDGSIDLIYDKSIPIEYGAEELNAISYTKGCYVGQEVISRTKYQGVVRKKIYKLESKDPEISAKKGDEVFSLDAQRLGIVCSSYNKMVISLLKEEKCLALAEKKVIINNNIFELTVPIWR